MLLKTKDIVQREAVAALDSNNGSGIVAMATGTGKSKIPIMIAQRDWHPGYSILISVPTEKLRDVNWKNEFYKWGAEQIWESSVERTCYISMHKIVGKHYDLVVLDEGHNITENNSVFFAQCTCDRVVLLTATMPDSIIKLDIIKALGLKIVYSVSMDEAVAWKLVSPYKITVVKQLLEPVIRNVPAGNKDKPFLQSEFDAYNYLSRQIESYKGMDFLTPKDLARRTALIRKRMHLIHNLETKTIAAKFILNYIIPKNERTLIFAGSIKQAETLCVDFFHSKIDKTKSSTNKSFEKFLNEEINRMSCVDAVNEGHNIPNMDNALIVQLNSKSLKMIQRIGRIVRFRPNHVATIYVIVAKNTVDENWAKSAMKEFDEGNITEIDFKDLKAQYYESKS